MSLVMFDLDGTLVDTASLYLTGVPFVVDQVLGRRIDVADYMDLWGCDVREWFARAAGDPALPVIDDMYSVFERYYVLNHGGCPAYPGVAEGMARLDARGDVLGVVTTRPQRRAELVREFPWGSSLSFVVGGDGVRRHKPAPDGLDFAIDRYGAGTATRIYVGDNASDMKAAKASRHSIVSVGALWGCRDGSGLLAADPDCSFTHFRDCAEWIASLTSP